MRFLALGLSAFLLLALPASPALARSLAGEWEFGAHLGRTRFIDSDELDDDTFLGVSIGYCFTDRFELALNFDSLDTDGDAGPEEADFDFLTIDVVLNYGEDAHKPFVLFGLGRVEEEIRLPGARPERGHQNVIELGAGYRGYFTRHLGIRLDGRLWFSKDDGSGFGFKDQDTRVSLGVLFSTGG